MSRLWAPEVAAVTAHVAPGDGPSTLAPSRHLPVSSPLRSRRPSRAAGLRDAGIRTPDPHALVPITHPRAARRARPPRAVLLPLEHLGGTCGALVGSAAAATATATLPFRPPPPARTAAAARRRAPYPNGATGANGDTGRWMRLVVLVHAPVVPPADQSHRVPSASSHHRPPSYAHRWAVRVVAFSTHRPGAPAAGSTTRVVSVLPAHGQPHANDRPLTSAAEEVLSCVCMVTA